MAWSNRIARRVKRHDNENRPSPYHPLSLGDSLKKSSTCDDVLWGMGGLRHEQDVSIECELAHAEIDFAVEVTALSSEHVKYSA